MNLRLKRLYLLIGGVVLLFLIGLGGWFVTTQFVSNNQNFSPAGENVAQETGDDENLQNQPIPTIYQILLQEPPPDASPAAFQQYRANVEFNAVAADKISFNNCIATPHVIKIVQNNQLTFENRDDEEQKIIINEDHTYTLKPKESLQLRANFGKGLGIYSFRCNESLPIGAIVVRQTL